MQVNRLALMAVTALASACAQQPTLSADDQAHLKPVICKGEDQCKTMWQRAQLWIAQNAAMKLQIVTDVVLQTYNEPQPSGMRLSYTVTKEPVGAGNYLITAVARCNNPYGCTAPPLLARARLHRYVRETPQ